MQAFSFVSNPETAKMVAIPDEVGAFKMWSQINNGVEEFEALARQLDYAGMQTGSPYSAASIDILDKHFNQQ